MELGMPASLFTTLRDIADPWAYPIVFLSGLAEAALFVGLVFPGETILLIVGALAWRGDVNLAIAIAAAVSGAVIGDSLGYEIGRRYGPKLRDSALGRRVGRDRWARSERYLRDRGGKAVFLGRFVTGPKAVVPALAGQARMPYRRFLLWNASSGLIWGAFHVGIGYAAGSSWQAIDHNLQIGGYALAAIVLVGGGGYLLVRRRRHRAASSHH
jgi:membrane protein DedA with SNARE-associated domain